MFIDVVQYDHEEFKGGFWGIMDTDHPKMYMSGFSTFRPAAFAIISTYRNWNKPIFPALKQYYENLATKNKSVFQLLEKDKSYMNYYYDYMNFNSYYNCIKHHFKRMQFTGRIK